MPDPISQIAALRAKFDANVAIIDAAPAPTPTTNFVTPDVQAALDAFTTDASGTPAATPPATT